MNIYSYTLEKLEKYFERFTVSVFVKNSTDIYPDPILIDRFLKEILSII